MGQRGVELLDHLQGRPFLGAVDGRRALGARERVAHVAGDRELRLADPWVEAAHVDAVQVRKGGAAMRQLAAATVEQFHAQGLCHAGAGVVGGASAYAENEAAVPRFQRLGDQFAQAVSGRHQRVALLGRHQRQPGRSRHLDDSGAAVAHGPPACAHPLAQRAGDFGRPCLAAGGLDESLEGAVPSVRHRHQHDVGIRQDAQHALSHRPRGFRGVDASLV